MKKLSFITRTENYFVTVDGKPLRNIRDLLEYLSVCNENDFRSHVDGQKNDFANWVESVLLFPELARHIRTVNTLGDTRNAIMDFFQRFDYKSRDVPDDKIFRTVDDYGLKNVQELYYYINNCDDNSFRFHLNDQKNDFANWVNDVLSFPELASRMRMVHDRAALIKTIKDFFTTGTGQEYKKYLEERMIKTPAAASGPISASVQDSPASAPANVSDAASDANAVNAGAAVNAGVASEQSKSSKAADTTEKKPDVKILDDTGLNDDEKIDLNMNLGIKKEEEPEDNTASNTLEGFKQYTDEDLEKFTRFVRDSSDAIVETDAKVEYLRAALEELKNIIKDLRRTEKDPLIADLMLRAITAKIDYYAVTKNPDDYAYIIKQMKDAQHEMEECSVQQSYNIAEEILKDLRLQGLAMKKS